MAPFSSDSAYDSDAYDPVKTRLSESQVGAEEPTNQSQCRVYSLASAYDSDNPVFTETESKAESEETGTILTPLTTPIFDFHKSEALTTPTTTPTPIPSPVKTSL